MHARVPNHHPRTTFHTVSLGTSVNEAKMKGRGGGPRPSSVPPDGLLLRAGDRSQVLVVVVEALECALCLDRPDELAKRNTNIRSVVAFEQIRSVVAFEQRGSGSAHLALPDRHVGPSQEVHALIEEVSSRSGGRDVGYGHVGSARRQSDVLVAFSRSGSRDVGHGRGTDGASGSTGYRMKRKEVACRETRLVSPFGYVRTPKTAGVLDRGCANFGESPFFALR